MSVMSLVACPAADAQLSLGWSFAFTACVAESLARYSFTYSYNLFTCINIIINRTYFAQICKNKPFYSVETKIK